MSAALIQRARDIAADAYIERQAGREPIGQTAEQYAKHVEQYAAFTREGYYDDGELVHTALAALKSIDVSCVWLAVSEAACAARGEA